MLGTALIAKARIPLNDLQTVKRWSDSVLLKGLNEGQRALVKLKPESKSEVRSLQLVQGPVQAVPTDIITLMNIACNRGPVGITYGPAITPVLREDLDAVDPSWRSATEDGTVIHFMFDQDTPREFLVYPPQPAPAEYVDCQGSVSPTDVTISDVDGETIDTDIDVMDIFEMDLIAYICYWAFSMETEENTAQKAAGYYSLFESGAMTLESTEAKVEPWRKS